MASTCKIVLGVLTAYARYMVLVINALRNSGTDKYATNTFKNCNVVILIQV